MKIQRIQRLQDCRIFSDFSWPTTLDEFKRCNLVYGWNGSGKTTLSTMFLGLQRGRNLLGGRVDLKVDDRTETYADEDTVTTVAALRVFNRDSVSRAVFEVPSTQLPPVYVLGEENVRDSKKVEELKSRLAEERRAERVAQQRVEDANEKLEGHCSKRALAIKNLLTVSGGGTYNNYDKNNFKAAARKFLLLDPRPAVATTEQRDELLAKRDSKPKPKLPTLKQQYPGIPDLTKAVQETLGKSVTSTVLKELTESPELSAWVQEGLALHKDNADGACRFCGEKLQKGRLEHLEAHFNDEFNRFQDELTSLLKRINGMYEEIEGLTPPQKEQIYDHLAKAYETARGNFTMGRTMTLTYLKLLRQAVERKKAQPFQKMDLGDFLSLSNPDDGGLMTFFKLLMAGAIGIGVMSGSDALAKMADISIKHNTHTDNFQTEIDSARQALELDEVAQAAGEYERLLGALDASKEAAIKAGGKVIGTETEIQVLEESLRGHHAAAARLTADLAHYLGRHELAFQSQDTGYTITRNGEPAMHLSEGEQTAIAFLYFLRSLEEHTFDKAQGVVVIDDPVSSLDANSIYSAFGFMKGHIKDIGQIFILTHDFTFFKLVKDWFWYEDKKDSQYYMLNATIADGKRAATLTPLDPVLSRYESEYHYLFRKVRDEADAPEGAGDMESCYPMPNIARRLLEGFLAFRCPGGGSLHKKVGTITNFDEGRRAKILRFVDVHSHHDHMPQAAQDGSILLQTRAVMGDVLEFIKAGDEKHFNAMMAATNRQT